MTDPKQFPRYCTLKHAPERPVSTGLTRGRLRLIRANEQKWLNGTVLHYYFFDQDSDGQWITDSNGKRTWATWTAAKAQHDVVRQGFAAWRELGIGIRFEEVKSRSEAELRIGFMQGDGSWSYVGREVLAQGADERTMNFGWDLVGEVDTAIHEIGHSLGFPHEHQNPYAGIEWDEPAVYAALAGPPNYWSRDETFHNIIRKITPDSVQGSSWDPNSVMHYPFEPGLIKAPAQYRTGLTPNGGLSARDTEWVKCFYPAQDVAAARTLRPFHSEKLELKPGEQADFTIVPEATRTYTIQTFGATDTVLALFEDDDGKCRYMCGDDDSGFDRNSMLRPKLFAGRKYIARVRLYYADQAGASALFMW